MQNKHSVHELSSSFRALITSTKCSICIVSQWVLMGKRHFSSGHSGPSGAYHYGNNTLTEKGNILFNIEHIEKEEAEEADTDNITKNNLAMQTVKVWDDYVDNEHDEQGYETDEPRHGEDEVNCLIRKQVVILFRVTRQVSTLIVFTNVHLFNYFIHGE